MVGGDVAAFQHAEPILAVLGSTVWHVGPSGSGSVVKLANQLMTAVNGIAATEGIALGLRVGIAPEVLADVIGASFGDSRMFRRLLPMIAARDFSGGAAIELYVKDIGIVDALGVDSGLVLPLARAAFDALRAAQAEGLGGSDISAMVTRADPLRR
jgi:3-hydroxyisobutyrate dehydrogenase-like beta-hydroxyacid dehydrogenase